MDETTGQTRIARIAIAVAIGVAIAVFLAGFWQSSASATWSSDPWLISAAMFVALAGPLALLAIPLVLAWNNRRRRK